MLELGIFLFDNETKEIKNQTQKASKCRCSPSRSPPSTRGLLPTFQLFFYGAGRWCERQEFILFIIIIYSKNNLFF
jgi:hypothetical protein